MFNKPLDRSVRECVTELREQVAKIAEASLEVVTDLKERVARLEMQMRAPRVCQHEARLTEVEGEFDETFQVDTSINGINGVITAAICKHCSSLYVPKE